MKQQKILISLLYILTLATLGCTNAVTTENNLEEESDLLVITQQQFEMDSMKIGEVTPQVFSEVIYSNGYIAASPQGIALLSSPVGGTVYSIKCKTGDYVKKGQVLCQISSQELIILQKDFAETAAQLSSDRSEYDRKKKLFAEKIGSEKEWIATESQYKSTLANYEALKIQLAALQLNTQKIEVGKFAAYFELKAPIEGCIANQHLIIGQYVENQKELIEIVNNNHLQLQLNVFEKDVVKLKEGDEVHFKVSGTSDWNHSGTLTSIGKSIQEDSKSVLCLASIDVDHAGDLVNRSYVNAQIVVAQAEAPALPNNAIMKDGAQFFVYVIDQVDRASYRLKKETVTIGRSGKEYTEILQGDALQKVLVNGVFNLP